MTRRRTAVAGVALVAALATPVSAHSGHDRRPGATQFDFEVRVTGEQEYAVAPAVAADRFGNLYAVARKEFPAGLDGRAATGVRASSYRWLSVDGGSSWGALPAPPASADAAEPGIGGDVAADDAGRVYVLDSYEADAALHRYRATGLGAVAYDGTAPVLGTGGRDVRPSLAAHGDGVVFYLTGSTQEPLPPRADGAGTGYGPGRFAVYRSVDGGATFETAGYSLLDSDRCRIAADHRRGSRDVYVGCLDGSGGLVVFASHDDGASFDRTTVGRPPGVRAEAPAVAVTTDGAVHLLAAAGSKLLLSTSRDGGRTWRTRSATTDVFDYRQVTLAPAPDGRLGFASYGKAGPRWQVFAGVFAPAGPLLVINFAEHTPVAPQEANAAPAGFPGVAFTPDSRLAVVWAVADELSPTNDGILHAVWSVREKARNPKPGGKDPTRTPTEDIPRCSIPGQVRQVADWQAIRAPSFRARELGAGAALTAYAVDPYEPVRLYATNGTTVMRSTDGGCRWHEVYSLESAPAQGGSYTAASARITAIVVPESRFDHRTVYLTLAEDGGSGVTRPHVLRSTDGEPGSFVPVDSGLPPAGRPVALRVSPTNADFLYLALDTGAGGELWASDEPAVAWQSREPLVPTEGRERIDAVALDPRVPNSVWAVRAGVLRHSTDGGRTWDGASTPATGVTAVAVHHDATGPARVVAWTAPSGGVAATTLESRDDGRTWTSAPAAELAGPVETAVFGSAADVLVVSTRPVNDGPAGLYVRDRATGAYVDLSPVEAQAAFRVAADRRTRPTYYALGADAVYRYAGDAIEPPRPPDRGDGSAYDDIDPPISGATVAPMDTELTLRVGETRQVDYAVGVGARRAKIDVFFVGDTSVSMTEELPGLRRELPAVLDRLRASGLDVWAGVAQFKTDSGPPVYRRERDLGPVDGSFTGALARLNPSSPGMETQLIALDQIITGAGLPAGRCVDSTGQAPCLRPPVGSICEAAPDTAGCDVRPGQQANFRDNALKVVVHATDTTFRNPEGTPRTADGRIDIPLVASRYTGAGVLHVGLAMHPEGLADLGTMSALTGTVAPRGGVDCDGDGRADLAAGAPVVCRSARGLDGVLRALLSARSEPTHVHFVAAPSPVLRSAVPVEWEIADQTRPSSLLGSVVVSCAGVRAGRYPVPLAVEVHDGPVVRPALSVRCVAPPVDVVPPRVDTRVPPVLPPPVVPPVPPPPPANLNPQPQVQSQPQLQAGVAQNEEEQHQVASVSAEDPQPEEELAMVGLLFGAAALTAGACAHALRTRTQVQVRVARARR